MKLHHLLLALVVTAAPVVAHAAASTNLVQNGDFATTTTSSPNGNFEVSPGNPYGTVNGWTVTNSATTGSSGPFYMLFTTHKGANQTETTSTAYSPSNPNYAIPNAYNQYGGGQYLGAGFNKTSPTGGNFMVLDGDSSVNGYLSQSISGLTVGTVYELDFYYAAAQIATRTGATTDSLQVNFGNSVATTPVLSIASAGFSGWVKQTFNFEASSTTQILSFLSLGTPAGYPPAALLDGVSLIAAPEPSTIAVFAVGLGALAVFGLRRRRSSRAV